MDSETGQGVNVSETPGAVPAAVNGAEPRREIKNLAMLDLTGIKSVEELSKIGSIRNVATIIVPESLSAALLGIPMENVATNIVLPDGANVKMHTGHMKMTGEALENANGNPDDVLIVTGQLFITTPVKKVGYKQFMVTGQAVAPRGSEDALGAGVTRMTGHIAYYSGTPRIITGDESYGRAFFELLDEPVTLIIAGSLTIEPDVTPEVLKSKVKEIVLAGNLKGPRALLPLLHARVRVGGQSQPQIGEEGGVPT